MVRRRRPGMAIRQRAGSGSGMLMFPSADATVGGSRRPPLPYGTNRTARDAGLAKADAQPQSSPHEAAQDRSETLGGRKHMTMILRRRALKTFGAAGAAFAAPTIVR